MAKSKFNSLYAKLVNFFKSKAIRCVTASILLICSILCMFMLDNTNSVRDAYLPFLNDNFISSLMALLNIHRYNITIGAWLIFICISLICLIFILGSIFSKKFVDDIAKNNQDKFKSYASARRTYAILYYSVLFLISACIIFIFAMLGGFRNLNHNTASVFVSLIYAVLLCLCFLLIIPITVFLIYFLVCALIYVISYIVSKIVNVVSDIRASNDLHNKISEEKLQKARETAGLTDSVSYDTQVENHSASENSVPVNKDIFLPLTLIDKSAVIEETDSTQISLNELALRFQSYAANNHKIYYELPIIRSYIAGLAASKLVILEGLSGTGKSMLPRMFANFTGSKASFTPVQATWRDKTDLLGFYSEFSKNFKTTDFLKELYKASYTDKVNEMVLDEVNLSRIEYYFADFLSILEYPESDWKIKIYDPELNQQLPAKLENGYVAIPSNTWFIGTANTDDSTFTITDKVYDRAIVIDFSERFSPIQTAYDSDPIQLSAVGLKALFEEAQNNDSYKLSKNDLDKFINLCSFVKDAFDIKFGNRIMVQIEDFVPVYVALGGTKEQALDFMFARKILRKLNGAYQDYVKEELIKLKKLIESIYGKGVFSETEAVITKISKRLV